MTAARAEPTHKCTARNLQHFLPPLWQQLLSTFPRNICKSQTKSDSLKRLKDVEGGVFGLPRGIALLCGNKHCCWLAWSSADTQLQRSHELGIAINMDIGFSVIKSFYWGAGPRFFIYAWFGGFSAAQELWKSDGVQGLALEGNILLIIFYGK